MPTIQISESTKSKLHDIQSSLIYTKKESISMNDVVIILIQQRLILNDIISDELTTIPEKYIKMISNV